MRPSRVIGRLRALAATTRGNVLMITAFALVPITFSTGMVIDYSRAARLQTKLNAVADASSLAATTAPMLKKTVTHACNAALNTFVSGSAGLRGLTLSTAVASSLTIKMEETYAVGLPLTLACNNSVQTPGALEVVPLKRVATVTYNGKSSNAFGGILGSNTIDIGGTSSSKVSAAPFIDIHMALDTSQSMGLAATDADAITLFNLTKAKTGSGCTFGCHVPTTGKVSNETIAKDNGVRLRIDVLRDATTDMIQTAMTEQGSKKLYRFGLYRIGQTLTDIAKLSDDLPATKTTVSSLTLGPSAASGPGDTNLIDMTNNVLPKITAKGDGKTQATARAFFFIVTDGVADVVGSCTSGHCTAPITAATCQPYKDAGVTVGVVYTTYIPIRKDPTGSNMSLNSDYLSLVDTFSTKDANNQTQRATKIAPNLMACASPGWYFEASDGASIHAAMQKLFQQASQTPTITK